MEKDNSSSNEIKSKSLKEIEEEIRKILLTSLSEKITEEGDTHILIDGVDDSGITVEMINNCDRRGIDA